MLSVALTIALQLGPAQDKTGPGPASPALELLPTIEVPSHPSSEAPAPVPPAAPAASDRWLLMRASQGTWPGWVLDSQRVQVYGWAEASFTASSDERRNGPLAFNDRANEFLLQQNWLRIERQVITSGTAEPTFGFRSDWILPGADYRFTIARGLFDRQLTADNGRPNLYGVDPIQFYAEAYFPTIAQGLDVKVGRFFCQYGVETTDAPGNALFSHAYTFIFDPFTHTGVLTTTRLTDALSVQAGLVLGSDDFIDPADQPTYIGSVKWAPSDNRNSLLLSVIVGSGRFEPVRHFNNPEVFDLVYTHQFNPRLHYSYESLFGFQNRLPSIREGSAYWFGILNYLTYDFTSRLSGTTRLEFFDDIQGQRTGFPGLYTALTAGLSYRPRRGIILRPELRYDMNDESRPFENKHGLFTAAIDLILRW